MLEVQGMAFFSCIVLSHNKPDYVRQALASLLTQTFPDWEAILFDSGTLYDQGYFEGIPEAKDPRIRVVRSWETAELRATKTIASWCFNECFRKNLVLGKYVTYLCDDDFYYPNAFAAFHTFAIQRPDAKAMYGSIDMLGVTKEGETFKVRELLAEGARGRSCQGGPLDCHVDSLQLCHSIDVLKSFPNDEIWPEDKQHIRHADGVFLEKIGELFPVLPVSEKIGANRKVPSSLNDGGINIELMREISLLREENAQLHRILRDLQDLVGVKPLRYRLVDKMNAFLKRIPLIYPLCRKLSLLMLQPLNRAHEV